MAIKIGGIVVAQGKPRMAIKIKGIVVAQGRPRFASRGKFVTVYDPPKCKEFKSRVTAIATEYMGDNPPLEGAIKALVVVHKSPPKSWSKKKKQQALHGEILPIGKPDFDNYGKGVLDAMNGIVFIDDAQICDGRVIKQYAEEDSVTVHIKKYVYAVESVNF